ncbi:MAG: glutathione S-transferase N-terminal domain-containing protein [Myxococcota bacterium]
MTLFSIPFTCALAVRLTLAERGIPHDVRWMKRFEHVLDDGTAFDQLNPKRRVPALLLPDGELLTEIVTVLTHLDADVPRTPAQRRRELEWECYVATELHRPTLFAMFDPAAPAATVDDVTARYLPPVLALLGERLADRPTLLGEPTPSPADFYLLWALLLLRFRRIELGPSLDAWVAQMSAREVVRRVLSDERAQLAVYSG